MTRWMYYTSGQDTGITRLEGLRYAVQQRCMHERSRHEDYCTHKLLLRVHPYLLSLQYIIKNWGGWVNQVRTCLIAC